MAEEEKQLIGQTEDINGKCSCERCGKKLAVTSFYTYKDGSKCEICKACLTAHIDNFDPTTFEWILKKMDVPYVPVEWNILRDRAFAKDPYKMTGLSVLGKYLAKMKLKQWNQYGYEDSAKILEDLEKAQKAKDEAAEQERHRHEAELKVQLSQGKITQAQYKTLTSTEFQKENLPRLEGNLITGEIKTSTKKAAGGKSANGPSSYEEALSLAKNPFQEQNFMSENQLLDPSVNLTDDDKMYLALKWGRLYTPSQWVTLQQMYTDFMNSFDIQGAARIDTLKKICKTSLKMDQAIDSGDTDTYQKLSRVYDLMMKSAKFTEAQNKDKEGDTIDSAAAIVDFVETHSGKIPRYKCDEPQDIVDKIIFDLKNYTRTLIYDDKSLAQEIEKYLKNKEISETMKKDKKEAREQGLMEPELDDMDLIIYKEARKGMEQEDAALTDEQIEADYAKRQVQHT